MMLGAFPLLVPLAPNHTVCNTANLSCDSEADVESSVLNSLVTG